MKNEIKFAFIENQNGHRFENVTMTSENFKRLLSAYTVDQLLWVTMTNTDGDTISIRVSAVIDFKKA